MHPHTCTLVFPRGGSGATPGDTARGLSHRRRIRAVLVLRARVFPRNADSLIIHKVVPHAGRIQPYGPARVRGLLKNSKRVSEFFKMTRSDCPAASFGSRKFEPSLTPDPRKIWSQQAILQPRRVRRISFLCYTQLTSIGRMTLGLRLAWRWSYPHTFRWYIQAEY